MTEDQGSPSLIDRVRDVGPAGIILGILVLGAIIAVVISASSGVEETAGEDLPVETTASTEATVAAEEPADPVDPPSGADTELREALRGYLQCLQDAGIRARFENSTETELIIGVRAGSGSVDAMSTDAAQACADDHVSQFGRTVTVVEVERVVDTTVGDGETDNGDDALITTDTTAPPGRPTTDSTVAP